MRKPVEKGVSLFPRAYRHSIQILRIYPDILFLPQYKDRRATAIMILSVRKMKKSLTLMSESAGSLLCMIQCHLVKETCINIIFYY